MNLNHFKFKSKFKFKFKFNFKFNFDKGKKELTIKGKNPGEYLITFIDDLGKEIFFPITIINSDPIGSQYYVIKYNDDVDVNQMVRVDTHELPHE